MTDLLLYQTLNGAEINVENGLAEMDNGLGTAFYLSLVGGNQDGSEYWGNAIEKNSASRLYGRTQQLLTALPVTTANILRIQAAVKEDLSWSAEVIRVSVGIPRRNYVNIMVDTEVKTYEYILPWEQTQ